MTLKSEGLQEHTKRLRFKSITNIQHCSGDITDKNEKGAKYKGYIYLLFLIEDV